MSTPLIRSALVQAYQDGAFGLETFYENVKRSHPSDLAEHPNNDKWAALSIVPTDTSPIGLGDCGDDEHLGFMQIELNYPVDSGENLILAKWEEIRAYFKAGRSFVSGSQSVTIRSCGRSSGRIEGQNYRITVSVYFFARVSRA